MERLGYVESVRKLQICVRGLLEFIFFIFFYHLFIYFLKWSQYLYIYIYVLFQEALLCQSSKCASGNGLVNEPLLLFSEMNCKNGADGKKIKDKFYTLWTGFLFFMCILLPRISNGETIHLLSIIKWNFGKTEKKKK